MASEKLEGIIKSIEEMSVLELADLVKTLEEKLGDLKGAAKAYVSALPFSDQPETIFPRIEQIFFTCKP